MNSCLYRVLCALLIAVCTAAPTWAGDKPTDGNLVVFGDSLSDPGNAFYLTGRQSVPPYGNLNPVTLVPDAPYAKGGHHFSNGRTWIEQLAKELRLGKDARPAFQIPGAFNYAIGGSTARPRAPSDPSLGGQILTFLSSYGASGMLADSVVVIVVGGNDVFDALDAALAGDDLLAAAIINNAVQSIVGDGSAARPGITALCQAGARKFLVGNAPDIGLTPAVYRATGGNPALMAQASILALVFNLQLEAAITSLPNPPCDAQIAWVDLFGALRAVVESGELNTNPPLTCVTPGVPPFTCNRSEAYFFQDGIHPTEKGHAIFADIALPPLESLMASP